MQANPEAAVGYESRRVLETIYQLSYRQLKAPDRHTHTHIHTVGGRYEDDKKQKCLLRTNKYCGMNLVTFFINFT